MVDAGVPPIALVDWEDGETLTDLDDRPPGRCAQPSGPLAVALDRRTRP